MPGGSRQSAGSAVAKAAKPGAKKQPAGPPARQKAAGAGKKPLHVSSDDEDDDVPDQEPVARTAGRATRSTATRQTRGALQSAKQRDDDQDEDSDATSSDASTSGSEDSGKGEQAAPAGRASRARAMPDTARAGKDQSSGAVKKEGGRASAQAKPAAKPAGRSPAVPQGRATRQTGTSSAPSGGRGGRSTKKQASVEKAEPEQEADQQSDDEGDAEDPQMEDADDEMEHEARRAGGAAAGPGPGSKRTFAEMVAGSIEEEWLKSTYRGLPEKRVMERRAALDRLCRQQPQWALLLRCGRSLIFHGLGSKRQLLQEWASTHLTDGGLVIVEGWRSDVTSHKVVAQAAGVLAGRGLPKGLSTVDLLGIIHKDAQAWPDRRVYVLIHNIEGPGLCNEKDQGVLGQLAACPNVHLIASMDHVNTPLMWSHATMALFNWYWVTAHTYAPYLAETLDKPSVLVGAFHQTRQRSAGAVLRSLVPAAQGVYTLIVEHQVDDPESEGLDFKLLYRMCRERFLVTSEAALQSHLTEFKDHELLATRRAADNGGEVMYVPMDAAALARVQAELTAINSGA